MQTRNITVKAGQIKKFLLCWENALLVAIVFLSAMAAQATDPIWICPLTFGAPIATYYIGDSLSSEYYVNLEIGQASWNYAQIGYGTSSAGTGFNWAVANYYEDGPGSNKRVRRNIGGLKFTASGNWYLIFQAKESSGSAYTSAAGNGWVNSTAYPPSSMNNYFAVTALTYPTVGTITPGVFSITLNWTKWENRNVLIVRSTDNAFFTPNNGTHYNVDYSEGNDKVIYNNNGTSTTDSGLTPGTIYYYRFYSENFDYYSSGSDANSTTLLQTWDGGGGNYYWGTAANWQGDVAPAVGSASDLYFAGNQNLEPINDYTAWNDFRNIYFNAGAASFNITGYSIDWFGNIENNSANAQTFNLDNLSMKKPGGGELRPTSGNLIIGGGGYIYNDNNATLKVYGNSGYALTLAKEFQGNTSAGLTIYENSVVNVTVAQTFQGPIAINAGKLVAYHDGALGNVAGGVTVAPGAALELAGPRTIGAEALSLSGFGFFNSGALRNTGGNDLYQGPITLAANSRINSDADTLTLDVATGNNAIEGTYNLTLGGAGNITINDPIATISGTLTKDGNGTLNLSEANTYSGGTTVDGGTLLVNNATGSGLGSGAVTVNSGGTLGGTGTFSGTVSIETSATLAPGNSIGELHTGDLTFRTGSSMNWEYDSSDGDLVSAGTLSFPVSGDKVTIYVTKLGEVVNCERTLFTFTGSAPSDPSVAYLNFDLTGTSATKAEAYVDNTDSSVKVLLTPEPGVLALAALALLALRKKLKS